VEAVQVEEPGWPWGTYEGWLRTFEDTPEGAGVDDEEWAKFEAEMKEADRADLEKTLRQVAEVLGSDH